MCQNRAGPETDTLRRNWVIVCLFALVSTSVFAAAGDEFYDRLYQRGLTQYGQANFAGAYSSLRLAAFGLVEDLGRFETAQVYMTLAANKLKREADARAAAQRVVTAERIQKRYPSLNLPDSVRKEFEDAAKKLLNAEQMGVLRGVGAGAQPAPVIVTAPKQTAPAPAPAQTPTPAPMPPPSASSAVTPAPQPARPAPSFTDAERALNSGQLQNAAAIYRVIVESPQLTHGAALRAAEGLYRARDFTGTIRAFERAGPIGAGEEHFHYYYAIALYESGRYAAAKRELRAALPFIEVTPDVERYRALIEQRPSE